jgi:hypothetical protein
MRLQIHKILERAYDDIKETLSLAFPNVSVFISQNGDVSCWVQGSGAGITLPYSINIKYIFPYQWDYLEEKNNQVALVKDNPKAFFYCTECGNVFNRDHFADSVFAGYYCKDCAEKPEIANLIAESKKRGFYD